MCVVSLKSEFPNFFAKETDVENVTKIMLKFNTLNDCSKKTSFVSMDTFDQ